MSGYQGANGYGYAPLGQVGAPYASPSQQTLANLGGSFGAGNNALTPYAAAPNTSVSPWGAYGSNMLTPWANNWGWNYNPGAVSDWSAAAGSNPQWLGYQTLQQFMPQQQWQPQAQWQPQGQPPAGSGYAPLGQVGAPVAQPSSQALASLGGSYGAGSQQQPGGYPSSNQGGQPQGPSSDQQLQMAMYWAGIGRPNYGGAGPGGDQGAAGQGY